MDVFETVEPFDASTHRQASTYTDTPDPDNDRIVRNWGVEPIPPEKIAAMGAVKRRAERDEAMPEALNILSRHRNQKDYGLPTTLTDEQAVAWAFYLQGLRDYPETAEWPERPL